MPEEKRTPGTPPEPRDAPPPAAVSEEMDAAMQSLAGALRVSFFLLKIVMVVLIVCYVAFSSFYRIRHNEVGLVLCFGKVMGKGADRIKGPGAHFALPRPIGEVVRVSTTQRTIQVNTFWRRISEGERDREVEKDRAKDALAKDRIYEDAEDAYLMTGDYVELSRPDESVADVLKQLAPNLVQARLTVQYTVNPVNAEAYFECIGENQAAKEKQLVRACLESAIVRAVARRRVWDVLRDRQALGAEVRRTLQATLNGIKSGITVNAVSLEEKAPPKSVAGAFNALNSAHQEHDSLIKAAEQYRDGKLTNVAGERTREDLRKTLDKLWNKETPLIIAETGKGGKGKELSPAERAKLEREVAALRKQVQELIRDPKTGQIRASGEVAAILQKAETYRDNVKNRIRGEARAVDEFFVQFRNAPEARRKMASLLDVLRIEAVTKLLASAREKFYLSEKRAKNREIRLQISRDPEAMRLEGRDKAKPYR